MQRGIRGHEEFTVLGIISAATRGPLPAHRRHRHNGAMPGSAPPATALPPPRLPFWHGDAVLSRSLRFTAVLTAPILAALAIGAQGWLAYAVLAGILAFMLDTGGSAPRRLLPALVAGLMILAGGALGTAVRGDPGAMVLALAAAAFLYGLTESLDPVAAIASRFLCLALAIAGQYAPLEQLDPAVIAAMVLYAWLVSVLWDAATGLWRPSTAPGLHTLAARLRATRAERLAFAAITATAAAAAFTTGRALGLEHQNWTVLAIVVVLRADTAASRDMLGSLFLGTLIGVAAALAYVLTFRSAEALMAGMVLAALVRWPLQQMRGSLGLAAMAAFVILLMQLVALKTGTPSYAPLDRLVDITLGCAFAALGLGLNRLAASYLGRSAPGPR